MNRLTVEVKLNLHERHPEATAAMVEAAIAPYTYRDYNGIRVVDERRIPAMDSALNKEISARAWIASNPVTALRTIVDNARDHSEILGELDCALSTLADAYDKWADGLPMPADNTSSVYAEWCQRRVGAHLKSKRLRDLAKALEVTR